MNSEEYVQKILKAYEEHTPLFTEDWANALNISTWTFHRWWKKGGFKIRPHRFISIQRFKRVREYMLDYPHASIKKVAIANGFKDGNFLHKWLTTNFPKIGSPSQVHTQLRYGRLFFDLTRD